jgi:hypothetical protein
MAGTTFGIIMIVIAAVAGLVALEVLVLAADRSPYFKHPHPDRIWSKVRGGVHLGDPRSNEAPHDEPVGPGGGQPGQATADGGDGTARLARSPPGSPRA